MKTMVVIPNWNGEDLLTECLDSLLAQTIKTTIVVVDNGSIDGSVILIEQKYPSVHLIKLPNNT
ncbi:glycosyltransferase, partial [bacterium]|nr:glycosyltransferase [bacterium]